MNVQRRLSAILIADVVGYSRLMGVDEADTLAQLRAHREEVILPKVAQHGGRIVKLMGDGLLAEFPSAVEAVACAVEIQVLMRKRNSPLAEAGRIVFRIGVNLGDIVVDGDDIYGDGVNVAARIEGLADPGGICVARSVRDQVRDRLGLTLRDRGEVAVKNIARPVRVFAVGLDAAAEALVTPVASVPKASARPPRRILIAAILILLLVPAAGIAWWQGWLPASGVPPPSQSMPEPPSDRPSIAVLPFTNLSADEEQEYFADGLTDDLITDLSKISGLFVIARNTVFTYRDQGHETRDIARELGVRYVLEGSVRRAGDVVRINAQLIDGSTGNHLWAERYDRPLADIFEIQDQVIENIIAALSVQLTDTERSHVASLPTSNLEAYDYYLRGEKLAYRADAVSTRDALNFYQRAIALDRAFAEAYAGYARVAVDVLVFGQDYALPSAVTRKRAYEAASRAVALNPDLARSYSVLALLQMLDNHHEAAVGSARRAVALNPNSAESHLNLAVVLVYAGHHDESLREMETVLRLNPKPPNYVHDYFGLALYMNRRYAEALSALDRQQGGTPSDLNLDLVPAVNARLGRTEAARAAVDRLLERWPDGSLAWYQVLFAHHAREEDRRERLEALRLAGLPEWPLGFVGDPANRLSGAAIEELTGNRTWAGERVGIGPFTQYVQADGRFIERGPDYQVTGTAVIKDDMLCLESPALLLGRQHCGPIYRNPAGAAETRDEFVHPSAYRLKRFSVR